MKDDFDLDRLRKKAGKKRINSKAKGNRFERKIADILNERFKTKDFCRSPGSGAFATTHTLPDYMKIHGDLITPKNFRFSIEIKKGYNKEGVSNLFKSNSIISDMIAQAKRDSEKSKKNILLILGQDRKDSIVITNQNICHIENMCSYFIEMKLDNVKYYCLKLVDLLDHLLDYEFFTSI